MHRIGIDIRLLYYRAGGIAAYMRHLSEALAALHPPQQFMLLHNFRMGETLAPGPNFRRANALTPSHHRWEALALSAELLPRRLDLWHSPDFIPPRWGARRYVITVHDLAFLRYPDIQTADSLRYYAGGIRRAVRQADAIIAVSGATRDDLIELVGADAEKIHVIWEGISDHFAPRPSAEIDAVRARYNLPAEYLLFVGTLEPRKNIPNMLRAYAQLRAASAQVPPLVLAGQKGWLSDDIFETITALNLQEAVQWIGAVPFADLPALYSGAVVHILVSQYEGFGFPPLEALACGTPTVVSARGALREVTGEAGVYADP
ncbi:MAG: glycosyltransferase family 4 protein, partial [Anaerolineales bacterium]